ncbi:hypothetical protein O181_069025 [Austropuccinia psidii MF-1]|uniref:Uncharacterized protein n=1 Tax=Austropuccinia psidii MF-1 TaxID=1389203 RepID=A0A9Q3F252_9BASI|nr:hypothetical protein [Austropuccinia psidii MF-1]
MVGHIDSFNFPLHNHFQDHVLEENFIPLETQSQANTPVTPSKPEGSKGKGKRHNKGLITEKKWTPTSTKRSRKPQNSALIQGKPTLITCTVNITIINPFVTSKGKFPKAVNNKFVQGRVKETLESQVTSQRTEKAFPEPEDLEEDTLDTVVDQKTLREIIPTLPFTFQFNRNLKPDHWKDLDKVLQLHQLLNDLFQWSMENKRFNLAAHWEELGASCQKICIREIPFKDFIEITKPDPDGAYSDSFRLTRNRPNQLSSSLKPFRNQLMSGQESPFYTILGSFQYKTRIQGQKQDLFQPKAERVRPNDPEAVVIGKRSTQEPEIVLNTSIISSPTNRNITPTQTEHNVVKPESNLNSEKLWLQISQFAVQTQEQLDDVKRLNERLQRNAILQEATIKSIKETCAQLSKASEETNKRLYQVFEEKHHCKRDRDFLDQDINKLFNVYQNMKPQPQGHALDDHHHQEDIKTDFLLGNK